MKANWKLLCSLAAALVIGGFLTLFFVDSGKVDSRDEEGFVLKNGDFFGPRVPLEYRVERVEGQFPLNSTLQDFLLDHGFTPYDIHQLIQGTKEVHDLNRVDAGHRVVIETFGDGRFRKLEYDVDDEKCLVVTSSGDQYSAEMRQRELHTAQERVFGRISESLWNTLISLGETPGLIMGIIDVMQWDVDFTAIQPNDSFKVVFEKKYHEGEFVKYGEIQSLQFRHGGRDFYAFLFEDPVTGKKKYYDYDGKGVKKAFLKVPFKFDYRISSGFSHSRFHPVVKKRMPHHGVDYAAPHGTPVLASASGRVVFAGRKGANGNLVKIRHPNSYVTYYLHLSKILVKSGQSVAQGQAIGRVGATGRTTGAHLDYRIQDKRGRFINPKKYVALPSDTGVPKKHMDEFIAVRDVYLRQLDQIPEQERTFGNPSVAG
ncbi:MAG TPA: peptidoglycan DD-metalloendopeptidase family protein [Acidobacteriota bacterium]|nr:peptidoglycan DD-metalloendopeptidase family protein [Acidobacteriota bacterium]